MTRYINTSLPDDLPALAVKYSVPATVGSLLMAYGLREVLRAMGGGYYCCNHAGYAFIGLILMVPGWILLLVGLSGPLWELRDV